MCLEKAKICCSRSYFGYAFIKSCGITTASSTGKVNERCLMRHGRWRTETCKNMYVKDSVDKKLDVTKARHVQILVYKTALSFASYTEGL